jgi:hypothetical protein
LEPVNKKTLLEIIIISANHQLHKQAAVAAKKEIDLTKLHAIDQPV